MIPRITIGQMNQRVLIQRYSSSPTAAGGRPRTWSNLATVWARVEQLKGDELVEAMKINPKITHRIMMRYRDLRSADRLVHKSVNFAIHSIINEESMDVKLVILAEQGAAT